jgi:hypothetical protein
LSFQCKLRDFLSRDAEPFCRLFDKVNTSDLIRSDNLIFVDEENVELGDTQQFINLRKIRSLFTAGIPAIATFCYFF